MYWDKEKTLTANIGEAVGEFFSYLSEIKKSVERVSSALEGLGTTLHNNLIKTEQVVAQMEMAAIGLKDVANDLQETIRVSLPGEVMDHLREENTQLTAVNSRQNREIVELKKELDEVKKMVTLSAYSGDGDSDEGNAKERRNQG